ncbi:MAG: O-antigen ligase family protein [Patescibacteria group bacterium]|nr:O-antigen ligase family protein [Patescibacteria group bacterium]
MINKIIKICDYLQEIILSGIVFLVPIYFAFVQENFNAFELNKSVVFRILLTIAFLAFAAGVFIKGIGHWRPFKKLFSLLALLGLSFFVSTYFSLHPDLSFWGNCGRQQGFYNFLHYWLFFVLLAVNFRSWARIKKIIAVAIISSSFVSLYGLLQYFNLDPLDWKEKALYTGRIFSTLGQPNFLGQYLIIIIPLTVFYLIFICRSFIFRFLLFVLILSQLTCLVFSYSRAAWLGLAVSLFVFLLLFFWAKGFKKTFLVSIGLIFLIILSAFSFGIYYSHRDFSLERGVSISGRIKSAFDLRAGSNKARLYYWRSAWQEFKQAGEGRKLFGYGPETLADVFVKYYRPEWGVYEKINAFPDRSHNLIFDLVLQFGLAGLVLTALFLGYILSATAKYLKNSPATKEYWLVVAILTSLSGYFVNNLFSFSLTVGYVYFYILLALLAVITFPGAFLSYSPAETLDRSGKKFFHPLSLILIWLTLFFLSAILILYYNINAWRADYYYMKVKKAEIKKDCRAILDNMEKVVQLNPMSTFYKEHYIYYNLNCFDSAASKESRLDLYNNIMSMANSVGPREYSFYTWTHIAHAKSLFGYYIDPAYYNAAEEDYGRLIKINPFITTTYEDLGRMRLWQKDYEEAMANFAKAAAIFPDLDSPYLNNEHREEIKSEQVRLFEMMGLTASFKKDWDMALDYYQQALELDPHYPRLYKETADVYYKKGDLGRAISYNERGYRLNPKDSAWPLAIALLYQEQGDRVRAMEYAEEAKELSPENDEIKSLINQLK